MTDPTLRFRILGPLTVSRDGERVDLGPPRQRAVLAVLLMSANEVVSVDRLIDQLWSGEPPASALGTLQAYISNLRRALEPGRSHRTPPTVLVTEPPGYVIKVDRAALDAFVFEERFAEAQVAADGDATHAALAAVESALACWTGPALADFEHDDFTLAWRARLDELRAAAAELRIELLILVGRSPHAVAELEELVDRWPLRERLRTHQVRALALAGRQADALRAYERARRYLGEELGIDPGPELEDVYQRVLNQDPGLFTAPSPPPTSPAEHAAAAEPAEPADPADGTDRSPGRPFVGRTGLVERILAAPRPGFVVISGEAGIGKTRLAEEATDQARAGGQLVAFGRCHDDEGAPPLWPWHQILAGLGIDSPASTEARSSAEPASTDAFARFEIVRLALQAKALEHPVMAVVDDVQWADLTSLRLLSFLATELAAGDLTVVITVRDTDVEQGSAVAETLARLARAGALHLPLRGLPREAIADLVSRSAGLTLDERAVDDLVDRTGGNPFYLGEVAQLWASAGSSSDVPELVGDVVRARLARLPVPTRQALAVAAALGRSFDATVLGRAAAVDLDDLLEALDGAVATRLLVDDGHGRLRFAHALVAETLLADAGPQRAGRYHLRAAEALLGLRSADVVVSAAEIARHLDVAAEVLGPSYAARAADAAVAAAEEASEGGAFGDAARWWERALHHRRRVGLTTTDEVTLLTNLVVAQLDGGEHTGPASAIEHQRRALVLAATLPSPERAVALTEAATIAFRRPRTWQWRPPGQPDTVAIDALEQARRELPAQDVARRVRVLSSLAVELLARPDGAAIAADLTEEAVGLARTLPSVDLLARALLNRILVLDVPGQRHQQLRAVEELLGLAGRGISNLHRALSLTWRLGLRLALGEGSVGDEPLGVELRRLTVNLHDPIVTLTRTWAAVTLAFFRFDIDLAQRRALDAWRRQRARGEWGAAMLFVGHESLRLRELGDLPPRPADALPEPPTIDEERSLDLAEVFWSAAHGRRDDASRLVAHHAPRLLEWRGAAWMMWMSHLVEAAASCDSPWTKSLYDEFRPFAGEVILRWPFPVYGAVDHYLGLAARQLGRHADAVAHFDAAIALHERIAAPTWVMRSGLERAVTLALDDARAALAALDAIDPGLEHLGLIDLARRSAALRSGLGREEVGHRS